MKTIIAYRKPNKLTNALSFLMSLTFTIVWLPFLRSVFDGKSYEWGTQYYGFRLGGAGVTPDFIFLVFQLVFYAALFFSLHWVKSRTHVVCFLQKALLPCLFGFFNVVTKE